MRTRFRPLLMGGSGTGLPTAWRTLSASVSMSPVELAVEVVGLSASSEVSDGDQVVRVGVVPRREVAAPDSTMA